MNNHNVGDLLLYSYWDFNDDSMKYFLGIIKKIEIRVEPNVYFVDWVDNRDGNREEYFVWEIEKFKQTLDWIVKDGRA